MLSCFSGVAMLLCVYINDMYQFLTLCCLFNGLESVDKFRYNKEYKNPTFDIS